MDNSINSTLQCKSRLLQLCLCYHVSKELTKLNFVNISYCHFEHFSLFVSDLILTDKIIFRLLPDSIWKHF